MTVNESIDCLTPLHSDARVRIFRRAFPDMEEFAGMYVDAYAVLSERYVVICDTLLCPADMQTVMENLHPELATGRQLLVINSHADWDHAWGNGYFTGLHSAPLLAHQRCRVRMQSEEARKELIAYRKRDPLFRNVLLTAPTLTFTHGLTLYGGDLTLELFPAPGHSSDSSAVWIPELRLLLAFDSIETPFPLLENAAGVQPLVTTLQRFLALQPQYVLCSHSENPLIHKNLFYIQQLEQRCRTLLLTHHPTDAELEHPSELIASPFTEFGAEVDGTPASAFYRQAHEDNIRFIMQAVLDYPVE
jgi:glyoxylase-like metal-dependent hydrolase (beta-lactamase superfamily II)